ncbi:MAG: DUF2079 domain-containing protein [Gaiella sp.]
MRVGAPRIAVGVATAAFAGGMSLLAVLQHRAFSSGRFDLGNLTQAVWSTAHGQPLEVTNLRGEQMSRLGAHFDPLVGILAPLWLVWPDPSLLLVVQAVAVAAGAIPVFQIASRLLGSEWAAAGFAVAYLLYPPTQWLVTDDFHPVAFAAPLLLFALRYLLDDRLLPFALLGGLACLTKEQVGIAVGGIALWYAFTRRRRAALAIAGGALAVAAVAMFIVVPYFAPGSGSPFAGRYAAVGGSPSGLVRTLVTDPGEVFAQAFSGRDLGYLLRLAGPLLGLMLLAPGLLAAALPELALNLLSDTRTQTSVHFHYTAVLVPIAFVAAIAGTARLCRLRRLAPRVALAVATATLVAGYLLGPLPLWSRLPGGSELGTRDHIVSARGEAAARVLARIPGGDAVSASNSLGAHLSDRRRIFSFPVLADARWVALDTWRPSYRDAVADPPRFRAALARLRTDDRFELVLEDGPILLFRRIG